ncbi:hypothetical protein QZH41_016917 [Actinostola sp. cb2023]|nr:hypothetical protein QZH41_016917 [Actinostola sp. cb2023]
MSRMRQDELDGLLERSTGFVFGQLISKGPKSCVEYLQMGGTGTNGIYGLRLDESFQTYDVYCDFTSEPGSAWTLVQSKSVGAEKNTGLSFSVDNSINESRPNWDAYRLSLNRMEALRAVSTHWRITCNFPIAGVDYRDYVRAKFLDFDMINFKGEGSCMLTEYMDIRGHNCTSCTVPWWQGDRQPSFHTDSSDRYRCNGISIPGSFPNEDNFGWYHITNNNFSCTTDSESTTNIWIGGYL